MILGALVLGAVGCAGSLDPSLISGTGGTSGVVACDAPTMVFASTCSQIGCHASSTPAGGLDLASAGVAGRLFNKPSAGANNAVCASNTTPYLMGGSNPATGFLFDKLKATPPCGLAMPEIGTLTATQTTCLNDWATAVTTGAITQ
jgi:hypothetical protein